MGGTIPLAEVLVFPFFLVLARMSAAVMVFPAISDASVNVRFRMMLAVAVSVALFPLLQPQLPLLPAKTGDMMFLLFGEIVIGILMGLGARLFLAAMSVAGELISFMAGFQSATLFDPGSASTSGATSVLLTLSAGLLVLVTGLHHELIRGVAASYAAFPPGVLPDVGDVNAAVVDIVAQVFRLGVMLAAPLVVTGLLSNAMFGVLNRLIPQLQVFFVSMPLVIAVSLFVLAASLGMMLQLWGHAVQGKIAVFQAESEL